MEGLKQLDEEPDGRGGHGQDEYGEEPADPRVLAPLRRGAPAGLGGLAGAGAASAATVGRRPAVAGAVALAVEPRLFALLGSPLVAVRQGTARLASRVTPGRGSRLAGWPASPRAGAPRRASPRPPTRPCVRPAAW